MPITLDQLRRQLSDIEPTEATFSGIGPSEIPLLTQLLKDPEHWMTARAVFALSRIADDGAVAQIRKALAHPRPEVRVAIAESASYLTPKDSDVVLEALLNDKDAGVRKVAIRSISVENSPSIQARLKTIETEDPVFLMRDVARAKRRALENKPPTVSPMKVNPFERPDPRITK